MTRLLVGVVVLALVTPSVVQPQVAAAGGYQVPAIRNDGWKTANAESLGVDAAA